MERLVSLLADHGGALGVGATLLGILSLIFRQLALGHLVFKKQLDELRADKEAEIARTIAFYDRLIAILTKKSQDSG